VISKRLLPIPLIAALFGAVLLSEASAVERVGYASQLFTVGRDGGTARLTHGRAGHSVAVWAPGGRRIATAGGYDPEILALDGRLLRRFKGGENGLLGPTWSPDGNKLAFAPCRPEKSGTDCRIVVVSVSGKARDQIARHAASDPYWSPDGKTIYYARGPIDVPFTDTAVHDIYAVPSKGGTPHKLVDGVGFFRGLSPNGRWLLFTRPGENGDVEGQLWIARTDGSDERMLAERHEFFRYGWAPGNRGVYGLRYESARDHFHPVVISTSGERRKLGADLATKTFAWSPDGKRIAWGVDGAQVRSSRPNGSGFRVLARIESKGFAEIAAVRWSPDGRTLLVVAHRHEGD
jgi:WD40-like Beta Propeller Repeat